MKELVIQRERTEAELAQEAANEETSKAEEVAEHKEYVKRMMKHEVDEVGPVINIGSDGPEDLVINIGTGKLKGPKKDDQQS